MLKLRKDQRGMGRLLPIVVVLVLAAGGAGLLIWSKNKDKSPETNTSQQSVTGDAAVEAACKAKIDDDNLCKFAGNWSGLSSYTSTIVTSTDQGPSTLTIETESKDRSRIITKQGDKEVSAMVIIGDAVYTKDISDGAWTKIINSSLSGLTDIKNEVALKFGTVEEGGDGFTYTAMGQEACGNLTCYKYQIIDPEDSGNEQFVWFDTRDYLLRRFTSNSGGHTTDMTINYDKVTVSEPSPVKELPGPTGASDAELQAQIQAALEAAQAQQ